MKLVKSYINEKFTEDSDPIDDLGIGIINFWQEERKKTAKMTANDSSKIYYGTPLYYDEALTVFMVLDELCKQIDRQEKINPQQAFLDAIKIIKEWQGNEIIKYVDFDKVIYALKKFFYIDINDKGLNIEESLNEKFTEDSDPIVDLNIGIIKEIKDFYDELRGKFINSAPYDHWLALELCIQNDKYDYIKFFIESEYIPQDVKLFGLRTAIFNNKYRIVKMFLKGGYNIKDALNIEHVFHLRRFYSDSLSSKIKDLINDAFHEKIFSKMVNERFTEDSDPVRDMDIGMIREIKEYCKDKSLSNQEYPHSEIDELLLICVDNQKYEYVKYLLENGANVNTSAGIHSIDRGLPLKYATISDNLRIVKLLLKYGASVKLSFDSIEDIKICFILINRSSNELRELIIKEFNK